MNRSGVRSLTVRYDDSNHWRIGGGDSSTATAGRAPPKRSAARTRVSLSDCLRPQNIGAPIELRNRAADAVVLRLIPVTEDLSIPFELHVGLEQPAGRLGTCSKTVRHADKVMQSCWGAALQGRGA